VQLDPVESSFLQSSGRQDERFSDLLDLILAQGRRDGSVAGTFDVTRSHGCQSADPWICLPSAVNDLPNDPPTASMDSFSDPPETRYKPVIMDCELPNVLLCFRTDVHVTRDDEPYSAFG
jgi:hypothetical protein